MSNRKIKKIVCSTDEQQCRDSCEYKGHREDCPLATVEYEDKKEPSKIKVMEQNIVEAERLIAEFMNEIYRKDGKIALKNPEPLTGHFIVSPKYHTSWDWLMPVVKKISACRKWDEEPIIDYVLSAILTCEIEATWLAVIDFIKYYNETIKTKP